MNQAAEQRPARPPTREALLDAVDELLAERGWSACSLQAVARRAGLTTGAVYSTFGSRGALLAAAVNRRQRDFVALAPPELDLTDAVAAFARSYFQACQRPEGVHFVLAQLDLIRLGATDPPVAAALRDTYEGLLRELTGDLAARGATGAVRGLAQRMIGVLQGLTLQQIALGGDLREADFVAAALQAVTGS